MEYAVHSCSCIFISGVKCSTTTTTTTSYEVMVYIGPIRSVQSTEYTVHSKKLVTKAGHRATDSTTRSLARRDVD